MLVLFLICHLFASPYLTDPLPSWNEGEVKQAILRFVHDSTTGPKQIPVQERIATFDQDGTLWVEHPLYTQFYFAMDSMKKELSNHPEWTGQEPYQTILDGNMDRIQKFTLQDIEKIIAVTHTGMTVDAFQNQVANWLEAAVHPRFKRPFTQLIYQPMLELIQYLQANGFKVYIVSGGGQEFIRTYGETIYGIPPENTIGTAGKVKYTPQGNHAALTKLPEILFVDDHAGKPEAINLFIGRRPVAAFGNSDGDREMLIWSQTRRGNSLQLLVHHDDPIREYAYDADTKIGTFSHALMEEAKKRRWLIVSMKNDWKVIFPWGVSPMRN